MKFKYKALAIVLASIGFNNIAQAADGTITFTGKIISPSCTVSGTSGTDVAVDLGSVGATAFKGAGDTAAARAFNINLTSCPTELKSASISFDGDPDTTNNKLLKIKAGSGTVATGVGIGIYESDSTTMIPFITSSKDITLANGAGMFSFVAKYVATQASVTAGDANGTATFTVSYK